MAQARSLDVLSQPVHPSPPASFSKKDPSTRASLARLRAPAIAAALLLVSALFLPDRARGEPPSAVEEPDPLAGSAIGAAPDATGTILGLAGDVESEKARKARQGEAERYASKPFPPAARVLRLSLREATEAALRNNLAIVVKRFDPMLLDRDVVSAKALLYDPIFDSNVKYTDRDSPVASIFIPGGGVREKITEYGFALTQPTTVGGYVSAGIQTTRTDTNSPIETLVDRFEPVVALSITQNLLKNFGWNVNRILLRRSQVAHSVSQEALKQQVIDSVFAVQQAYWELVGYRENLKAERLGLRLAQDLLRQNEIQVKVGTMAPLDVLQAKAQTKAAETAVNFAENAVRQAQNVLLAQITSDNELLTQDLRVEATDAPTFTPKKIDLEQSLQTALERRPDLHIAQCNVRDKTLAKKGARNNVLPKAEFQFTGGYQGLAGDPNPTINPFTLLPSGAGVAGSPFAGQTSFRDATSTFFKRDGYSFWSVGLMVTYPIGNRDARAQYAKSKLALEKSEKAVAAVEQVAALEVKRIVDSIEADARGVESSVEARKVAEEQLDAEEKKLAVGLSTNFEVLQLQKDLTARRKDEIAALTAYRIALAALAKATGTSLDELDIEFLEEE
jgi:outer membrane protein